MTREVHILYARAWRAIKRIPVGQVRRKAQENLRIGFRAGGLLFDKAEGLKQAEQVAIALESIATMPPQAQEGLFRKFVSSRA